jgi:hypothetical protein
MNQFGSANPVSSQICAQCEGLLMDVLDHTASPADQAFFDKHLASCTSCSRMFIDAKRGGAWLEMLRDPRPEPSAGLFERILAQTSGAQALTQTGAQVIGIESGGVEGSAGPVDSTLGLNGAGISTSLFPGAVPAAGYPGGFSGQPRVAGYPPLVGAPGPFVYGRQGLGTGTLTGAKVLPFRLRSAIHSIGQTMLQPRLAMTAAMAFFSIALTLNLTGVRVSELSLSDLQPSNIRRGFYEANASVVRYCDNLRVVYELEARVHDMRRTDADSDADSGSPSAQPGEGSGGTPQDQNGGAAAPQHRDQKDQNQHPAAPSGGEARPKAGPGTSRREPLMPRESRLLALLAVSPMLKMRSPQDRSGHSSGRQDLPYEMEPKGDRS